MALIAFSKRFDNDIRHTNNLIISYLKANQIDQIYELLDEVNHTLDETKPKIYIMP